jgi:DNA-binding NarL/FixJ family response regulator
LTDSNLDILIVHDCSMDNRPAVEFAMKMAAVTRVIVIARDDDLDGLVWMRSRGIEAVLPQSANIPSLLFAIRAAMRRDEREEATPTYGSRPLSQREEEVLRMIASGLTHRQTGTKLGISTHTVDTYVRRVKKKLNIANKAELTRAAMDLDGEPYAHRADDGPVVKVAFIGSRASRS